MTTRPDRPVRSGSGVFALAALLAFATVVSCGHAGRPVAPLPRVPSTPVGVSWQQQGDHLAARGDVTPESPGGRALRAPVRAVGLVFLPPSPALAVGWDTPARSREFLRAALRLPGETLEIEAAPVRRRVELRLPLADLPPSELLVVALALQDSREISLPSARVVLRPVRPALVPPVSASVEPFESGIRLRWTAPADPRSEAAAIFRAVDGEGNEWAPWRIVPAASGSIVDDDVQYGRRYSYALAFATAADTPLVLSEKVSAGEEILHRDIYPPARPRELDAVAGTGRIRVFWFEGGSPDEALVVIERSTDGGEWAEIGRVALPDAFFEDHDVQTGKTYRYRARSIDVKTNESIPTDPTGPMTPRPGP